MPKVYITISAEPPRPEVGATWWLSGVCDANQPALVEMAARRLAQMWNESTDGPQKD